MQAEAQSAGGSTVPGLAALPIPRRGAVDRAHLEANMAAALLLQSPREYRRWLLSYVRHLAGDTMSPLVNVTCLAMALRDKLIRSCKLFFPLCRAMSTLCVQMGVPDVSALSRGHGNAGEGDEGRLRELCEELMGPVRRSSQEMASSGAPPAGNAGPSRSSADVDMAPDGRQQQIALHLGQQQHAMPGLDRRAMLREDVLREMSRNRALQRLVGELQELLAEAG